MANKQLNSRIIHKHDTEANWNKATGFTPKQGEIIVYDRDSTYSYERFKIGDGITNINSLPFADDNKVDKTTFQQLIGDTSVSDQISSAVGGLKQPFYIEATRSDDVTLNITTPIADILAAYKRKDFLYLIVDDYFSGQIVSNVLRLYNYKYTDDNNWSLIFSHTNMYEHFDALIELDNGDLSSIMLKTPAKGVVASPSEPLFPADGLIWFDTDNAF